MPPSSHVIELLSTTAMTAYSSIERMTRPMKEESPPLWMHRGDPKVRLEYLASIVTAFAAPLPVESMSAIKTARALILESYFDSPAPPNKADAVCSDDDALFDRAGPSHPTLIEYCGAIIRELAKMDKLERHKRVQRMQQGDWTMSMSLAPAFAIVSWRKSGPTGPVRRALRWEPLQADLPLPQPKRRQGIQRLTWIPPEIFLTLADIYADVLADSAVLGAALSDAAPEDGDQISPGRETKPSRACDVPVDQTDLQSADQFCSRDDSLNKATAAERMRESKNAQALSGCITGRPLQLFGVNRHDRTQECTKADFWCSTSAGAQGSRWSGC